MLGVCLTRIDFGSFVSVKVRWVVVLSKPPDIEDHESTRFVLSEPLSHD